MRYLLKLQPLKNSNSGRDLLYFNLSKLQKFRLSTLSNSSKIHNFSTNAKTHMKKQREPENLGSLFHEITEILGSENLIMDKTPSGFSISKETHLRKAGFKTESPYCRQPVCENAEENVEIEKANISVSEETQLGNLVAVDVSPIVHKVTKIVRSEIGVASMEEQLDSSGVVFSAEIVEKVLKRCFKVPHLALRFFNWVKLRSAFCHTTGTYNTMIYIAVEAKEFPLVEELMEEMEKSSCEMDIKTWTILISHYGNSKLVGKALLTFEKMRKSGFEPDYAAYKLVTRMLCMNGKSEIALEFYKEMVHKEMTLDMNLYKLLLNCFTGSGDIASVHLVANDMIKVSLIPEHIVCACMLRSFCISGRTREALELIRDMKNRNITLDSQNFETLVKGLCRANRIGDALEIVAIMKKNNDFDGKVYGIIISGYLRKNDISKAFGLFQSIKDSGYLPTTSTYTELMQHLFRSNDYQKARELCDEMVERGVQLDSVALTAMVAGYFRHNCLSEAWELFNNMEEKGIKATQKSYSVFIKELCKISRTDEVIKVLDKMRGSKITIGDDIFGMVLSYLEKKGDVEKVEKVKQMHRTFKVYPQEGDARDDVSSNCEVNVQLNSNQIEPKRVDFHSQAPLPKSYNDEDLREICRILSSSIDWSVTLEALEKCTIRFTPELVVAILHNCSRQGRSALHFFSWVGKKTDYSQTTDTYNMAIKISGSGKDFKHMRSLFFEMRRKGFLVTSDTWTIMILLYGRTGLTEIALRTFREMKANGCKPTGSTYKYLILSLCGRKGRKVNEAIETFGEMIRVGCVPDKELVETYLNCLCEVGKLVDARKCIESLCKIGFTVPLRYSLYIRALCRVGRVDEALELLDEVGPERLTLDQYIYGSLVHGLLKKGRLEEAMAKIESMKDVGVYPTVHVYTSLVVHYLKEKQINKALEILEKMKKEGCEPTIVTYTVLINGYMELGKIVDAWNVFRHLQVKGPFPDFKTYSMFISCLCNVGKSEEALNLISEMLENGIAPSTVNFRTVFYGLNREGKKDLAGTVLQKKLAFASRRKFST